MVRAALRWIPREIGSDEILIGAGLGLIAAGLWDVWRPGALIVPGAVLVWIGLPQRAPFVSRPVLPKKVRRND